VFAPIFAGAPLILAITLPPLAAILMMCPALVTVTIGTTAGFLLTTGVGVGVGVALLEGVGVGVGVRVGVGVGVGVALLVGVGVGVGVGVALAETVGVAERVGVGVGEALTALATTVRTIVRLAEPNPAAAL